MPQVFEQGLFLSYTVPVIAKMRTIAHLVLEPPCPLLVGAGEVHAAAVALEALLVVVVVLVHARSLWTKGGGKEERSQ